MNENKLLIPRIDDLFRLCDKYACARFSPFLDGGEIAEIEDSYVMPYGCNVMWFGGADNCERKILGVFPEWEEPSKQDFPIKIIRFEGGFSRELSHRDYLGTIMSLGIERNKTGDIIVNGKTAYVFAYDDIADYISSGIRKIGNQGVKSEALEVSDIVVPEPMLAEMNAVCASERLDAVVGAAAGVSRSNAAALIRGGKVKLNHRETADVSKSVKNEDLISIRGFGRYIFRETGAQTRKGRVHIKLYKYI